MMNNFIKILTGIILISMLSLVWRPSSILVSRPLTEDGYYSLTVARDWAQGKGITIDGVVKTNGFQPLFTFLTSIVFLIEFRDVTNSLRLILALHWIVYVLTILFLSLITTDYFPRTINGDRDTLGWCVIFCYSVSVLTFLIHFNGLESGLLLLIFCVIWYLYQRGVFEKDRGRFLLGVLCGFMVLCRIDTVFFCGFLILQPLFVKGYGFSEKFRKVLFSSISVIVISSPWWAYNYLYFGSIVPISGKAQQLWGIFPDRIWYAVSAITKVMLPFVYLGASKFEMWFIDIIRIVLSVLILKPVVTFIRMKRSIDDEETSIRKQRSLVFLSTAAISMVNVVIWYTASSFAVWFYPRYFSPIIIFITPLYGVALWWMIQQKYKYLNWGMFLLTIPILSTIFLMYIGNIPNEYYEDQLRMIENVVPADDVVGAYQTGTLGFFRDGVINLDGKVNPEALLHKDHTMEYVQMKKIRWLCDWKWKIEDLLRGAAVESDWQFIAQRV